MTGRILAGVLGVLALVIVAVVVPLGIVVTVQQADDFRSEARRAVHAVSAVAEEHLDDRTPISALDAVVARFAANGDGIAVLDAEGRTIAAGGPAIPRSVLSAAHARHRLSEVDGAIFTADRVGDADRNLGLVVLRRSTEPLHHRQAILWLTLLGAAAISLVGGGLISWSLSRWIARPLTALSGAAQRIGEGQTDARADSNRGPAQVRQLAATFNEMGTRVESLLEMQRGMTAEVSHQLRTPLAALRLRLELLAADEPERADEIAALIDETGRLSRLVDGLLAVARAEQAPSTPQEVRVDAVAATRVDAWQPVAAEREIELRMDIREAHASVTPGNLEQILDNLLDNAIEALTSGGHILVTVSPDEHGACLTVSDDGPGMSPERRVHAVSPFVTDRSGSGGTGLGLAIVSRLLRADGGTMQLTDTPGGGLTVAIVLPS